MIVFVKLSPRVFMALNVDEVTTGWHAAQGIGNVSPLGFRYSSALVIHRGSWSECVKAASEFARDFKQLVGVGSVLTEGKSK